MTATTDTSCALIERAHYNIQAAPWPARSDVQLAASWTAYLSATHRLRPQDIHIHELMDAVQVVLVELIDHGCIVVGIEIGESAVITLHRAPPAAIAAHSVAVRRSSRHPGPYRRVVLGGVRIEWPDAAVAS